MRFLWEKVPHFVISLVKPGYPGIPIGDSLEHKAHALGKIHRE
jgi:hypothetical protein